MPIANASSTTARRPLAGPLLAARLAWTASVILALLVALEALAAGYDRYREPCVAACAEDLLRPADLPALAAFGLSASDYAAARVALAAASALVFAGAGGLIFALRGHEPVALLVSAMLVCLGAANLVGDTGGPAARVVSFVAWGSLVAVLFLFPSGRFVPGWTRWAAWALITSELVYHFLPGGAREEGGPLGLLGLAAWLAIWVLGLGAQVYRYRRVATVVERQQTKWVVFGLAVVAGSYLLATLVGWGAPGLRVFGLTYASFALPLFTGLVLPILPVTLALAVLRRGLWAVDPLIRRTLVYGVLTALVALIYVAVVSYLGLLFRAAGSLAVSVIATVLVAALFQPLRERVQRAVSRLLYGERDDPNALLARLGARLEATLAPEAVLPTIVETLAQALRLPYAAVALDDGAVVAYPAGAGAPDPEELLRLPLVYQGRPLGALLVAPRAAGEPWSSADRRLLEATAGHAGVAVHGVRLMGELRRLNAELQHSREGLVLAREEERRRMRADLHDDLAPTLAALAMAAGKAGRTVRHDPDAAIRQMDELRDALRARVGDIRRLAHNLRPPALDELGLLGAVRERAASYAGGADSPEVWVEADEPLPALPAAVEVAAYRIVQEALANVARHSGARRCTVGLRAVGGWLELEVADDGRGVAVDARPGIGVRSMRERATELGGSLAIAGRSGGGTLLVARLPYEPDVVGEGL